MRIFVGTCWTHEQCQRFFNWQQGRTCALKPLKKSHFTKLTLNQFFAFRDVCCCCSSPHFYGISLRNSTFLSSVCSLPGVIVIVGNETDASCRFYGSIFGFIMVFINVRKTNVLQQKQADGCVWKEDCLGGSGKVLGIYEPIFRTKTSVFFLRV